MRLQQLITAFILAALSVACAPNAKLAKLDPKSAEYKYESALIALEDGMYPEAIKGLSEVNSKHPYTAFARLADLRISDAYCEQVKYDESVGSYRRCPNDNPRQP